jgi:hypothetical protein
MANSDKKFDNPLEAMRAMPEPEPPKAQAGKRPKRGAFANPLSEVSARDKAQSVGSSLVAGQYIRRTFTFTPGQLQRIKGIAQALHIPETSIARWLIDEGLAQWDRGVRPELEEAQVKLEPKLRNW